MIYLSGLNGIMRVLTSGRQEYRSFRVREGDRKTETEDRESYLNMMYENRYSVGFFFKFFFLMWTIFKDFIAFVTILLLFYVLVFWPQGMWDPSSPTRDRTRIPCIGRRSLNHWTSKEVPSVGF